MKASVSSQFETLYKTYSAMVYSIAVEISPTKRQAKEILISTFQKAYKQNIEEQKYPSTCITLFKLLIQSAHEQLNNDQDKTNIKLEKFKNSPMLHYLLCEQATLENHCNENNITKEKAGKNLRAELLQLRPLQLKNNNPIHQE